jgi:cell division protein FtsQ
VRQVRKPRQPNVRSSLKRTQTRAPARGSGRSFGKRQAPPGALARLGASLARTFSLRRPMLLLSVILTVLAVIAAVLISGVIGRTVRHVQDKTDAAISGAGFGISQVHIVGNARTPQESIMAALGLQPGQPIFAADLFAARARLLRLPWVKEAEVRRRYPDDIGVTVVEKQPFARWQIGERIYVVERDGRPITDQNAAAFVKLPLLVGDGAPQNAEAIVAAVQRHRAVAARVAIFQYQSGRRWNLILDNAVTVDLPEYDWSKQLDALETMIVDKGVLERNVMEIDLRSPSHYFFKFRRASDAPAAKTEQGRAI